MKNRNLVSLSVTFGFLAIGITGILMYFGARGGITTIHVIFGLLFVAFTIFHMVNNWNSLKVYTRDKKIGGIRKEFILVSVVLLIVLLGSAANLGPFPAIAHAGEEFGREEHGEREKGHFSRNNSFEVIITNDTTAAKKFTVLLEVYGNGEKEIYSADVDLSKGNKYKLTTVDGKLPERASLEIKQ